MAGVMQEAAEAMVSAQAAFKRHSAQTVGGYPLVIHTQMTWCRIQTPGSGLSVDEGGVRGGRSHGVRAGRLQALLGAHGTADIRDQRSAYDILR
jgi:hypothetical protein